MIAVSTSAFSVAFPFTGIFNLSLLLLLLWLIGI